MTQVNQDGEHLRLLSIFHYVTGGLMALLACVPIIHVVLGAIFMLSPSTFAGRNGQGPPTWFGLVFMVLGGVFVLIGWALAALVLYAGRCLSRRKRHTFCLVVAGMSCLFFPVGTALGVFTILVLMRPSVKELFQ